MVSKVSVKTIPQPAGLAVLTVASESVKGSLHPFEDRLLVDEARGLFAVADGVTVSSFGSGGVAAELALRLLREEFSGDLLPAVDRVCEEASKRRESDRTIGETTLTAGSVNGRSLQMSNLGDSPGLLLRRGSIRVLTIEDRDASGRITQVVGMRRKAEVHSSEVQLEPGDVLIIASDGVGHVLQESFLEPLLRKTQTTGIPGAIVKLASQNPTGYDDDKSVIALSYTE
jgi:serine/threonine protein phosphatase PrpC